MLVGRFVGLTVRPSWSPAVPRGPHGTRTFRQGLPPRQAKKFQQSPWGDPPGGSPQGIPPEDPPRGSPQGTPPGAERLSLASRYNERPRPHITITTRLPSHHFFRLFLETVAARAECQVIGVLDVPRICWVSYSENAYNRSAPG